MKFLNVYFCLLWIWATIFLFTQCKTNQILPEQEVEEINLEDCIEIERLTNNWGEPYFPISFPMLSRPQFNPNNSEEILYDLLNIDKKSVIKYNLKTKEKTVLYQGVFQGKSWGKNDWILLRIRDDLDFNIYKMKSDGSDLTRLNTSGNCHGPQWNKESDRFIYKLGYTTPTTHLIADANGTVLDSSYVGLVVYPVNLHTILLTF